MSPPSRIPIVAPLFLVGWLMGLVHPEARSCQICLPFPTQSLADRVLAADHLVLARENPDQAFTLRTVQVLQEGTAEPPPLDLFLDSSSRRSLATNKGLTILCGWTSGDSDWRRLAVHDDQLAPIVAAILQNRERWQKAPEERVAFFADFLAGDHGVIADLAHIEVAGAPYAQLVQYADRLPRDQLLARLANYRRIEWHALYILFLAQSEDPRDHERIREEIASAAEHKLTTRTSAWATAYLEIDGAAAVKQLQQWYGNDHSRRHEERQAILAAVSVHGSEGEAELRDPIVEFLGTLLATDPDLALSMASLLTNWNRNDLRAPIAALLRNQPERFDTDATLALRRYLRVRTESQAPSALGESTPSSSLPANIARNSTPRPGSALPILLFACLLLIPLALPLIRHLTGQRSQNPLSTIVSRTRDDSG